MVKAVDFQYSDACPATAFMAEAEARRREDGGLPCPLNWAALGRSTGVTSDFTHFLAPRGYPHPTYYLYRSDKAIHCNLH